MYHNYVIHCMCISNSFIQIPE